MNDFLSLYLPHPTLSFSSPILDHPYTFTPYSLRNFLCPFPHSLPPLNFLFSLTYISLIPISPLASHHLMYTPLRIQPISQIKPPHLLPANSFPLTYPFVPVTLSPQLLRLLMHSPPPSHNLIIRIPPVPLILSMIPLSSHIYFPSSASSHLIRIHPPPLCSLTVISRRNCY